MKFHLLHDCGSHHDAIRDRGDKGGLFRGGDSEADTHRHLRMLLDGGNVVANLGRGSTKGSGHPVLERA